MKESLESAIAEERAKAAALQEELLAAQEALVAARLNTQSPHQGPSAAAAAAVSQDFESLKVAHSELQACHSELLAKSSDVRHRDVYAASFSYFLAPFI